MQSGHGKISPVDAECAFGCMMLRPVVSQHLNISELFCEPVMPMPPRAKTPKACRARRVATNASPKNHQRYAAAADP